jgi:hypothetical protein
MLDKETPAFPTLAEHGFNDGVPGMLLRDYFAAKAMAINFGKHGSTISIQELARSAYEVADAMLYERCK